MAYQIKERTAEEIASFQARHEGSAPDPFILTEGIGDKPTILSTHATREDAEKEQTRWKARDLIQERIEEIRDEILTIARTYDLDEEEAIQTAKEAF